MGWWLVKGDDNITYFPSDSNYRWPRAFRASGWSGRADDRLPQLQACDADRRNNTTPQILIHVQSDGTPLSTGLVVNFCFTLKLSNASIESCGSRQTNPCKNRFNVTEGRHGFFTPLAIYF